MKQLEVARVARAHGIRGLVRVDPYWAASSALDERDSVQLELPDGKRLDLKIEQATRAGKGYLVKFVGVESKTAADGLRGARVFVEREELPPNEVYLVDLVGAEVVGPEGPIGRVTAVEVNPSLDTLIIERPDGSRVSQALLPNYVARLDAEAKRVELSSLDGLFE